jgi:hypothetical protein
MCFYMWNAYPTGILYLLETRRVSVGKVYTREHRYEISPVAFMLLCVYLFYKPRPVAISSGVRVISWCHHTNEV